MMSTPVATPPAQLAIDGAQLTRYCPRGGGRSGGGQARCYAFPARPEAVSYDAMITCIVLVCHGEASILFNTGSSYSYVSSYFAHYLDMPRDSLVMYVHVSAPVGGSNIVDRVYCTCVVAIRGLEMRFDLLLLSVVNFEVNLVMDCLSPYNAILDYHIKIVTLAMLGFPRVERFSWSHS